MRQIEKLCANCGQPLIEIDFNRDYFMHLCDNMKCLIRRQPQGSRAKNPDPLLEAEHTERNVSLAKTEGKK